MLLVSPGCNQGFASKQRDRTLQSYVRSHFKAHLKEIFVALKNEYSDWDEAALNTDIRDQVSQHYFIVIQQCLLVSTG